MYNIDKDELSLKGMEGFLKVYRESGKKGNEDLLMELYFLVGNFTIARGLYLVLQEKLKARWGFFDMEGLNVNEKH